MNTTDQPIDYTPLTVPLARGEYQKYKPASRGFFELSGRGLVIATLLLLLTIPAFPFLFLPANSTLNEHTTVRFFGLIFLLLGFVAMIFVLHIRYRRQKLAKLNKFAQRNNISFTAYTASNVRPGTIFNQGDSAYDSPHFTLSNNIEIGNHHYLTGDYRNRTEHHWAFVCIQLDRNLPHMILDAKSNNNLKLFSNLPELPAKNQILSLEGNFDSHFTLYAPKQYEQDALYIFTPDVMAKLIEVGQEYDIEIIDNYIYLYSSTPHKLTSPETWQRLFDIISTIKSEISKQGDNYHDEKLPHNSAEYTGGFVAQDGERLKWRIDFVTIILITAIAAGYIYFNVYLRQ